MNTITQAIADNLGVTVQDLLRLAEDGGLDASMKWPPTV